MKELLKYLRHYVKESILAPLFKMLEASFELFVPLVMAAIIDTGIKNSDKPYIFKMAMVSGWRSSALSAHLRLSILPQRQRSASARS